MSEDAQSSPLGELRNPPILGELDVDVNSLPLEVASLIIAYYGCKASGYAT